MNWTTYPDIQAQCQRLWDTGKLAASMAGGEPLFPLRLRFRRPGSADLSNAFGDVRKWIGELDMGQAKGYRIVWRTLKHRVIGENKVPAEIWVDDFESAVTIAGKRQQARQFGAVVAETRERIPELLDWLARHPLKSLPYADRWNRLLDVVAWLRVNPRPNIYLRQVDIPGIDSKFIEESRAILTQLLDRTLPAEAIAPELPGIENFCARYGFRQRPLRVRFRLLDEGFTFFRQAADQDITVNSDAFAHLEIPVRHVFVTENEINFLAFPMMPASIIVFGAGYGFEMLAAANWVAQRRLHYWGDIDTHGFAILDQLRALLPHAESFLMDRATFLDHRMHWVREPQPHARNLPRLNENEMTLFDDLRCNRLGEHLRLEQERVEFSRIGRALDRICNGDT